MISLKSRAVIQADGAQRACDHPPTGCEDGANQQHLDMPPDRTGKQRRERTQECDNLWG
jgi:hypothetical protein